MARKQTEATPVQLLAESEDAKRLALLIKLKDYAIKNSFDIGDEIIQGVNTLDYFYVRTSPDSKSPTTAPAPQQPEEKVGRISDKDLIKLDRLTVALTRVTYPITIENVGRLTDTKGLAKFVSALLWLGIGSALLSGIVMGIIKLGSNSTQLSGYVVSAEASKVLLALLLGTVGAILYVMLPNGKLNIVAGLDEESIVMNRLRIALGALLGFVLFVIKPSMFNFLLDKTANPFELLIPLIGGYSVTLVIGILAKAITAVEITLNLDEKKIRATLKRPLS